MNGLKVYPIGKIKQEDEGFAVVLDPPYRRGLKGLGEYSHVQVLWWADGCDNDTDRAILTEQKPYTNGPETLGVFALRSPERPNPIAVSAAGITYTDEATGRVGLAYIDAFPGSPVLDLKPYTPSIDRVEHPVTPGWCRHWPGSCEESGCFDWEAEFNF